MKKAYLGELEKTVIGGTDETIAKKPFDQPAGAT